VQGEISTPFGDQPKTSAWATLRAVVCAAYWWVVYILASRFYRLGAGRPIFLARAASRFQRSATALSSRRVFMRAKLAANGGRLNAP
jgi:hypothetical protein